MSKTLQHGNFRIPSYLQGFFLRISLCVCAQFKILSYQLFSKGKTPYQTNFPGLSAQSRRFWYSIRFIPLVCWSFDGLSLLWKRIHLNVEERTNLLQEVATRAKAKFCIRNLFLELCLVNQLVIKNICCQ